MAFAVLAMFKRASDPPEYASAYAIPAAAIPVAYIGALHYAPAMAIDAAALHDTARLIAGVLCIGGIAGLSSQVR